MLTRKYTSWKQAQEEKEVFQFLKQCLINPPILPYRNFSCEFLIHADASGYGVGSVLSQIHKENGEEKEVVIAYASRHLNTVEKKKKEEYNRKGSLRNSACSTAILPVSIGKEI